mgnify:CR=1 FL=1
MLNLKVKYRESFRPFAPSVLREDVSEWFDLDSDSPYMLLVADVAKSKQRTMSPEEEALFGIEKLNILRSSIPSVTHVDYSARVQTVHEQTNHRYYQLIKNFKVWFDRNFRGIITIENVDPINFEMDQLMKKNKPSKIYTKFTHFKRP